MSNLIGVDEAGRGSLAGPVCAAAVVMRECLLDRVLIKDSKTMTASQRDEAFDYITSSCIYGVGFASVFEIEILNILQATMKAMQRALTKLDFVLNRDSKIMIDGNQLPNVFSGKVEGVVKGDTLVSSISAASVVAKVSRDRIMGLLHTVYPGYDFISNKGYPTKAHINYMEINGISVVHRKSFAPVRRVINMIVMTLIINLLVL